MESKNLLLGFAKLEELAPHWGGSLDMKEAELSIFRLPPRETSAMP